ncbi:MAG TPA: hypothetical protein VFV01_28125 [Spirillospora sp.]|nr:hypothetical protein [Spirillospora sp.]
MTPDSSVRPRVLCHLAPTPSMLARLEPLLDGLDRLASGRPLENVVQGAEP